MARLLTIQTCGPILVALAFISSELSNALVSTYPGSGLAWYVHLEVLRPFGAARSDASPLSLLVGPGSAATATLLVFGLLAMQAIRFRFGVAVGANLGFLFAAFLAHAWWAGVRPGGEALGHLVMGSVLAASFLAFAASHVAFIGAIRSSVRKPTNWREPVGDAGELAFSTRPRAAGGV